MLRIATGFQILPRPWSVERTSRSMIKWKRPVRDYEQRVDVSEALIQVALGSVKLLQIVRRRTFSNGL
jgi:hypothetical protein